MHGNSIGDHYLHLPDPATGYSPSRIGSSDLGDTFQCLDTRTQTVVALKVLRDTVVPPPPPRHPNIMPLLEDPFSVTLTPAPGPPRVCLVTPFCEAGNLADVIRRGTSHEARRQYLSEIIAALAFLHEIPVLHRNLCLTNVLIQSDPCNPFGHAMLSDLYPRPAAPTVTTAPELPTTGHTRTTDIYAMGAIVYCLFSGQSVLYQSPPALDTLEDLYGREGLPERLCTLLARMCAHDPNDRPGAARVHEAVQAVVPDGGPDPGEDGGEIGAREEDQQEAMVAVSRGGVDESDGDGEEPDDAADVDSRLRGLLRLPQNPGHLLTSSEVLQWRLTRPIQTMSPDPAAVSCLAQLLSHRVVTQDPALAGPLLETVRVLARNRQNLVAFGRAGAWQAIARLWDRHPSLRQASSAGIGHAGGISTDNPAPHASITPDLGAGRWANQQQQQQQQQHDPVATPVLRRHTGVPSTSTMANAGGPSTGVPSTPPPGGVPSTGVPSTPPPVGVPSTPPPVGVPSTMITLGVPSIGVPSTMITLGVPSTPPSPVGVPSTTTIINPPDLTALPPDAYASPALLVRLIGTPSLPPALLCQAARRAGHDHHGPVACGHGRDVCQGRAGPGRSQGTGND
ncbi:hypothetical protein PAPYR_8658 [Paratrimastix pyriformis]|uniref:non-specific serine/threonine protein kinase n=1 Tax=Paratrimastix pyriformis TaxID=342808 RepID=A0ABQ8UCP5_9EUKA|nr:hypothetical protein PAPYR_8658 [Paratrimastix pyriformis]